MSARKLRRLRQKQKSHFSSLHNRDRNGLFLLNKKLLIYISLSVVLTLFVFSGILLSRKSFWDGQNKLAVAVNDGEGASVLLFDPQYKEVVTIKIPKGTEVEVARQLGVWKIESIWELGKQEKVSGKLLAESLTKYFHYPTAVWADSNALGLTSGNIKELYKAVFSLYDSNLTLGDKLALAWFSFNISNAKRVEVDLVDSGYLSEVTLLDGTPGYRIVEPHKQAVLALFADPRISKSTNAVSISNASGEEQVGENVGQIVEVLGAKIAALDNQEEQDVDCIVSGQSEILVVQVSKLFDCSIEKKTTNFDLEIRLGKQFAKRF